MSSLDLFVVNPVSSLGPRFRVPARRREPDLSILQRITPLDPFNHAAWRALQAAGSLSFINMGIQAAW
jgi:hypothetical protein